MRRRLVEEPERDGATGKTWMAGSTHGCPARFLLEAAHDIDSTRLRSFANSIWTRKGINAVRHINSVFHDILKLVPWAAFDGLVERVRD